MSVVPGEEAEDEWPSLWCAEQFYLGLVGGATLVQSYQAAFQARIALYGSQGAWSLLQTGAEHAGSWRLCTTGGPETPWHVPFIPGGSMRGLQRNQDRMHEALANRRYVGLRGAASTDAWFARMSTVAAMQYLQEFGASYTGGVFWLDGDPWGREQDTQKALLRTSWDKAWSEQEAHAVAAY